MRLQEFRKLLAVNDRLQRDKDGCPWDLEQTHESLKRYMFEEACELVDAIDEGDPEKIKEELGDVLYQVLFHAKVSEKNGGFDIGDVCRTIREKLIRRHPHIFHTTTVSGAHEVMVNWEKIKKEEYKHVRNKSALDGVPNALPALQQAEKIQERASRVGFDWKDIDGPYEKLHEEIEELHDEVKAQTISQERVEEELGDVLFALVNVARFCNAHPELALRAANKKFTARFHWMEEHIAADGKAMKDMSINELDAYWDAAKEAGL